MEGWIWLTGIAAGLLILVLTLVWAVSRGVLLAKKLKPFAQHLEGFKNAAERYPEAVKFYSNPAKSKETPNNKP
jgi:hypothetical protein